VTAWRSAQSEIINRQLVTAHRAGKSERPALAVYYTADQEQKQAICEAIQHIMIGIEMRKSRRPRCANPPKLGPVGALELLYALGAWIDKKPVAEFDS